MQRSEPDKNKQTNKQTNKTKNKPKQKYNGMVVAHFSSMSEVKTLYVLMTDLHFFSGQVWICQQYHD